MIANPTLADIPAAFEKRRLGQARDMAGEILGNTALAGIGGLARLDPDTAIKVGETLGIPADSEGRRKNLYGTVIAVDTLLEGGMVNEAIQLLDEEASKIEAVAGQGEAQRLRKMQNALVSGDQEIIGNFRNFAKNISPQVSAKDQSSIDLNKARTDEIRARDGKPQTSAEGSAFNELISDFTPEQKKTAKLVKAGLKGRAMSNAVLSAIESGDVTNLAEANAEIKQAEKFAELTGSSRGKAIDKGFDSIIKIDRGIKNIDDAITALGKGAGVGAVEKLWPSIKGASVELDNIRGRMALDVVGATTFGALSKGELDLAKNVALPTGLDTAELTDYLTRKKTAQTKLRAYYDEQIQFLDQGGTVAGFLRQKKRSSGSEAPSGNASQSQVLRFDGQGNPI
jgi:hypothetical protein